MNHFKIYNQIIESAKPRGLNKTKLQGYYECHHVQPKCMEGKDNPKNLVLLTAKEHFICHVLLCYIYPTVNGLLLAFHIMSNFVKCNSNKYKNIRENLTASLSEAGKKGGKIGGKKGNFESHSKAGKIGGKIGCQYLVKHNTEHPENYSIAGKISGEKNKGKHLLTYFKEHPEHQSKAGKIGGLIGGQMTCKHPNTISQKRGTCPHCGKETNMGNLIQYHFNKCSKNSIEILIGGNYIG